MSQASAVLGALQSHDRDLAQADARSALLERRADRARLLMAAAEVVLLGHDDDEDITVTFTPTDYAHLPGVRHL